MAREGAQRLKVRGIEGSAAAVQRSDVIALEATGPAAFDATPAVALKYAQPKDRPSL